MDSTRFDNLTKALATATSRRQALKTIAATTLGSILGLAGIGTAFGAPTCKPNGHGCGTNKQCCSGYCDPTTHTCGCQSCSSGQDCLCNGTCATPCTSAADCPGGDCYFEVAGTHKYCISYGVGGGGIVQCSSDCGTNGCPQGQFCGDSDGTSPGFCWVTS
jgi:hypothetical protein